MIEIGRYRDALGTRTPYTKDGAALAYKTVIVGPVVPDPSVPNAFLIEQEPNTTLPVHFHGYGQFQVVTGGDGVLGSHPLAPTSVHYAGQRTAYGPIKPGASGLSYLTLRPATEGGAFYMPASRALRDPAIPRFERYGSPVNAARATGIEMVLEEASLGLGAWHLTVQEGQILVAPALANGAGRFYVVFEGVWELDGQELGPLDILWADAQQAPLAVRGGHGGLRLLVVQFPSNACQFPHPDPHRPQITRIGG